MSKKLIKSLTAEQEAKIKDYFDEGIRLGLGTYQITMEEAKPLVSDLYKQLGIEGEYKLVVCDSPKEGMALANLFERTGSVEGKPSKEDYKWNGNFSWGSQDLYWLQFYRFIVNELPVNLHGVDNLETYFNLYSKVGWIFPYEGACILTRQPTEIHTGADGIVRHNEHGPAIKFADGFGVYCLNGVNMTGCEHLLSPDADIKEILNVQNVEQRGELIKLRGPENMLKEIGAELLDIGEIATNTIDENGNIVNHMAPYELYRVPIFEDMPRIGLKMVNPSVEEETPFEWVHPDCKTIEEANNWRVTGKAEIEGKYQAPSILT